MERDRAPDAARPGECFFAEQIVLLTAERMKCADAAHSVTVDLAQCCAAFSRRYPGGSGRCVAAKNVLTGEYIFFGTPTVTIRFWGSPGLPAKRIGGFLLDRRLIRAFCALQRELERLGYRVFDLT